MELYKIKKSLKGVQLTATNIYEDSPLAFIVWRAVEGDCEDKIFYGGGEVEAGTTTVFEIEEEGDYIITLDRVNMEATFRYGFYPSLLKDVIETIQKFYCKSCNSCFSSFNHNLTDKQMLLFKVQLFNSLDICSLDNKVAKILFAYKTQFLESFKCATKQSLFFGTKPTEVFEQLIDETIIMHYLALYVEYGKNNEFFEFAEISRCLRTKFPIKDWMQVLESDCIECKSEILEEENHSPTSSNVHIFAIEGEDYIFKVTDFLGAYSDPDGDNFAGLRVIFDTPNSFTLNNRTLASMEEVTRADIQAGQFRYLARKVSKESFKFQVKDARGAWSELEITLNI